jgi:RNA polymerase sigma-70 factor (ECF subfamily)
MRQLTTTPIETEQFPARNEKAFTKAFKWLFTVLVTFAMKIVKCYHAANDTVSEVFTKLWDKAYSFKSFQELRFWMYRTTRNASLNAYYRNRYEELSDQVLDSFLTDDDGMHHMNRERALDQIAIAVTNLPAKDRRLFRLAYVQGKSKDEIAKRLGIAAQTVANRKTAVLKSIRSHLTNYRLSRG